MRSACVGGLAAVSLVGVSPAARAATFVPPGSDWRTLETPHFRIHFPVELRAIARKAAVFAENAHERLGPYFGRQNDVSDMTILDTEDTTNGFGTPFPEARLTFFVTPPSPDEEWYTGRYDNWLKMIVSHEYSHVLQARGTAGPLLIPGFLNAMFVRAFLPDFSPLVNLDFLPDFLKEGMAVYQESLFTGGGRVLEGQFDMVLRTQFRAGTVFHIDQASGRYSLPWAPGGANYLSGVAFYTYVVTHYGDMAAAHLTRNLGQFPWGGINLAAERTFGKSVYGLWDDAMAYYKQRYERQVKEIEQLPLTPLEKVTHTGRNHRHPKWLDDNTLLYTRSPLVGAAGLVESRVDGSHAQFLLPKASDKDFTIAPDHRHVYFYADGDGPPLTEFHDLYRFDLETHDVEQITHGMRASFPCPSPDGKRILATLNGEGRNDLGMFDEHGKLLWRLRGPDFGSFASEVWSPDGKHVALVQWTDGHTNIVLLDPLTHTLTRPAPDAAVQLYPTWSPDSQTLLYCSDRTGVMNVDAVRLSDGKRFRVTNVLGGAFDPAISPDGKRIALSTYGPTGFDIAVMPYDPASWIPENPAPTLNADGHILGGRLAILPRGEHLAGSSETPGSGGNIVAAAGTPGIALTPPASGPVMPTLIRDLGLKVKYLPSLDPDHDPVIEAAKNAPEYPYNPLDSLAPQLIYPRLVLDSSQYPALPGLSANLSGGGALLALQTYGQDAIRQHSYFATLGMETAIHQPFFSFSYLNDVWAPTLGVSLAFDPAQLELLPTSNGVEVFGRQSRSAGLSITYPTIESPLLSSWLTGTSVQLAANFTSYGATVYDQNGNATTLEGHFPSTMQLSDGLSVPLAGRELPNQVNTLSLTIDSNSTTRPFRPISPVGGPLWAAGVERADTHLGSDAAYTKAWGDVRYFVPTFGRQVLALRAVGGTTFTDLVIDKANGARIAQPAGWLLGTQLATGSGDVAYGMATSAAIHDLDDIRGLPGSLSPIVPVRGYTLGAPVPGVPGAAFGVGNSAAVLSAEYRVPVLDVSRGLGTFPVFLDRISVAPFVDIGKAWTVWNQSIPLVGAGAEARFHIELAQAIPTEVRIGYARGLTANLGANQIILGLGAAF